MIRIMTLMISFYPVLQIFQQHARTTESRLQVSTGIIIIVTSLNQCCGSMTFWYRPRSANSCLWLMDPDPTFSSLTVKFFCLFLFEGTFASFFKDKKSKKKSQNSRNRNQCFSCYFCFMIEGSGSVPLTNGSGSRRPKNIRIRIRIRNIVLNPGSVLLGPPKCRP